MAKQAKRRDALRRALSFLEKTALTSRRGTPILGLLKRSVKTMDLTLNSAVLGVEYEAYGGNA